MLFSVCKLLSAGCYTLFLPRCQSPLPDGPGDARKSIHERLSQASISSFYRHECTHVPRRVQQHARIYMTLFHGALIVPHPKGQPALGCSPRNVAHRQRLLFHHMSDRVFVDESHFRNHRFQRLEDVWCLCSPYWPSMNTIVIHHSPRQSYVPYCIRLARFSKPYQRLRFAQATQSVFQILNPIPLFLIRFYCGCGLVYPCCRSLVSCSLKVRVVLCAQRHRSTAV